MSRPMTRGYFAEMNSYFKSFQSHASPEITLTHGDWAKIDKITDIDELMKALKELVPSDYKVVPGSTFKYQFIFPKYLTDSERQKYYVMVVEYGRFYTSTRFVKSTRKWAEIGDKQLGIFVRNF